MEKPKYETGFIKCYPRPEKNGKIPGYQRRILLKSDGSLKGCPEAKDPKTIVVMYQEDFENVLKNIETLENGKSSLYEEIHRHKMSSKNLKDDNNLLNEKIDQLNKDMLSAVAFIGMSYAGIQDLKSMSWMDRMRNKIPKSLQDLRKPPSKLLPMPEDPPIDQK